MSDKKDFYDPFQGDEEGFPDDIDLGDLDALEIVDCWEEDDGVEGDDDQDVVSLAPEKLQDSKIAESISPNKECSKPSHVANERNKPAVQTASSTLSGNRVDETASLINSKNSVDHVQQSKHRSDELSNRNDCIADTVKVKNSEKGKFDVKDRKNSGDNLSGLKKSVKDLQTEQVDRDIGIESGVVELDDEINNGSKDSNFESIEREKRKKILLKDEVKKSININLLSKSVKDSNGNISQEKNSLISEPKSKIVSVKEDVILQSIKREPKETVQDATKRRNIVQDAHQINSDTLSAKDDSVSKTNCLLDNSKHEISAVKKNVPENENQSVSSSESGEEVPKISKKSQADSTCSEVSQSTSMESKVEKFLHEIASKHPITTSTSVKTNIMNLPDGPPGVDLDELEGDVSTEQKDLQAKNSTTPDSTAVRIDGRLYANYAQIFGDDSFKGKRFSISPDVDRHFDEPLRVGRTRHDRSESPAFTEERTGRYPSPHPAMKILWNSPPKRPWANYRARKIDDDAIRALSRSLSRERQPSYKPGTQRKRRSRSRSRSRSPVRHSRISLSPARSSSRPRTRRRSSSRQRSPADSRLRKRGRSRSRSRSPTRIHSKSRVSQRPKPRSNSRSKHWSTSRSRSRSRPRNRNHSPVRPPSRGRYVSPAGSWSRRRLSRRSPSGSHDRVRTVSRSPSWTEKGRKRALTPDRSPRTSPVGTKKLSVYSSPPGHSWKSSRNASYPNLKSVPKSTSNRLEDDMDRFIATNRAVTGQSKLFLPTLAPSPTPVSAPVSLPLAVQASVPVSIPAPVPVPVPAPVPAPTPVPAPVSMSVPINLPFSTDLPLRGSPPPPPPPPPSLNTYFNDMLDGLPITPEVVAPTINAASSQGGVPSTISLSSFLEAAVKGNVSAKLRENDARPAVPRFIPVITNRCREAIEALSGLSSYGRFVFSPARVQVVPSRAQGPFQPWESPVLRSLSAQHQLPFTTPTPEQKADLRAATLLAAHSSVVKQSVKERESVPDEKPPKNEEADTTDPDVIAELRKRLESVTEENARIVQNLTSRLNSKATKTDASTQTFGDVICDSCRQQKVTVIMTPHPGAASTGAPANDLYNSPVPPTPSALPPPSSTPSTPAVIKSANLDTFQPIGDQLCDLFMKHYATKSRTIVDMTYCSPRATLRQLHSQLVSSRHVPPFVAFMAGTSDMILHMNAPVYNYYTGLFFFARKNCKKLLVFTPPPIPMLMNDMRYQKLVIKLNKFILTSKGPKVIVCDIYPRFFIEGTDMLNTMLYEEDGIHPNADGLDIMCDAVEETLRSTPSANWTC